MDGLRVTLMVLKSKVSVKLVPRVYVCVHLDSYVGYIILINTTLEILLCPTSVHLYHILDMPCTALAFSSPTFTL